MSNRFPLSTDELIALHRTTRAIEAILPNHENRYLQSEIGLCVLELKRKNDLKRTRSSPVPRPRAEFWNLIPRSSLLVAISGVFSLFASIALIVMLMSPVRQTIASAAVTVAIY